MKFEHTHFWRVWSKSLGEKTDYAPNHVALVRTIIILVYIVTNFFIVAGVLRHW